MKNGEISGLFWEFKTGGQTFQKDEKRTQHLGELSDYLEDSGDSGSQVLVDKL